MNDPEGYTQYTLSLYDFRQYADVGFVLCEGSIKVGDTISDIREGVQAGVWTVGVVEGSSQLGLSQQEYQQLSTEVQEDVCRKAEIGFR